MVSKLSCDAKYEHVGQDTDRQMVQSRSRKKDKDLKISDVKTKSEDNDKGLRSISQYMKNKHTIKGKRALKCKASGHVLWAKDQVKPGARDTSEILTACSLLVLGSGFTRDAMRRRAIDQSADGKPRDKNAEESWALIEDLAPYDNEGWNDPRDFAKPVKAISLPHDVPNSSNRRLIELEKQVQCLMEAHLAPKPSVQVNKIASLCEICSGPHDTQYCIENPEQAFVDYASLRTDKARGLATPDLDPLEFVANAIVAHGFRTLFPNLRPQNFLSG
ncbi:hypothetical protein Tco_0386556 [Tanacetum coccineum]